MSTIHASFNPAVFCVLDNGRQSPVQDVKGQPSQSIYLLAWYRSASDDQQLGEVAAEATGGVGVN